MGVLEGASAKPPAGTDSVATYFREQVFPEETAARNAAKQAREDQRNLHNFVQDSARHSRREARERANKLETEPKQTKWDCGCITTVNPDGTFLRSQCGKDDCLYERGMAKIIH